MTNYLTLRINAVHARSLFGLMVWRWYCRNGWQPWTLNSWAESNGFPSIPYGKMPELSPAAQTVNSAYRAGGLAAALEAAADQVVPEHKPWHRTTCVPAARHRVRLELLAIAAELKAQ